MLIAMRHLLRLGTIFPRCIPAFFRSRNQQALVEFALRRQLATYALKGPKARITPVDPKRVSMPPSEAWLSYCLESVVRKTQLILPTRRALLPPREEGRGGIEEGG
jgi:hypothetical protein